MAAARAAYIAGFASTSNLQARFSYGVPSSGTSAHAFTLVHDSEREAFAAQVASLGPGTTLLVDTFDVEQAVRAAVEVAGPSLGAVRIDSGDLPALAVSVRALLDSLGATQHPDHPHRRPRRVLDRRARRRPGRRLRRGDLAGHRVRRADRGARLQAGGALGRAHGGRRGARLHGAAAGGQAVRGQAGPRRAQVGRARADRRRRGGDRADLARAAAGPRPGPTACCCGSSSATARSSAASRSPTARARHAAALAELPGYAASASRGYPAIPTVFGTNGEEA